MTPANRSRGIEHRDFRCHEPCEEQLPCGHPCKLECWDFQHQCGKCPKPRTMSVARPSSPPTDLAGARGSGANAVPVTKPRLPVREAAPSASSATPNGGTRGYQPKPSAARTRPAPEVVSPPPKPKSYSSVATQPRPPAPNSRDLHYPALGSGATPLPPYTRTSPQRRLQANHEKPSTHDTRKDSPDKWDRFVNGGVKVHDAELQALAGAGPAKQETGWDLAASIAKKSDKPASVRTKELSPAKGNGRERKRWRDRHGVGSSDEEQQPPPGPPAIDASSKAQAAPAAPPNLMDEDLLIDLGGDDGQPARRSPSPPRRVVEEGDLIDLMD